MISIRGSASSKEPLKANILPCRIKYTGPASSSRQFWNPTSEPAEEASDGTASGETHTSYFRGRKLIGTKLVVPDGYQGRVLNDSSSNEPLTGNQKREVLYQDDEDNENGEIEEAAQWMTASSFSEIMVWGHELKVDGSQDGVVKGLEEWMGMSKILNGYEGV